MFRPLLMLSCGSVEVSHGKIRVRRCMKRTIKQYSAENIRIQITDFELLNTSFYGCDARFDFEIRDKETDVVLATDCETIENAFMGVDDSDEIYSFLEEKGIDFSEEYDDDYDKLPDDIKKEYEEYELLLTDAIEHESFFDEENSSGQDKYIERIMEQLYLDNSLLYIVHDGKVAWIKMESDYYGVHLSSDDVEIHKVYEKDMEDWIYEVEGNYFFITSDFGMNPHYSLNFCEHDE